jgi:chaperonin GroES|tara:strand:- start:298 stop:585 length:288 start_codon:yes stop_codon:yes gene_type:complete
MFNPIADKVVIKKIENEGQTSGGVIIPDTTQEGSRHAEVIAVGPGRWLDNGTRTTMQVKPGDKVIYPKVGNVCEVEGEEYYIVREIDILTILENK